MVCLRKSSLKSKGVLTGGIGKQLDMKVVKAPKIERITK